MENSAKLKIILVEGDLYMNQAISRYLKAVGERLLNFSEVSVHTFLSFTDALKKLDPSTTMFLMRTNPEDEGSRFSYSEMQTKIHENTEGNNCKLILVKQPKMLPVAAELAMNRLNKEIRLGWRA